MPKNSPLQRAARKRLTIDDGTSSEEIPGKKISQRNTITTPSPRNSNVILSSQKSNPRFRPPPGATFDKSTGGWRTVSGKKLTPRNILVINNTKKRARDEAKRREV